MASPNVLMVFPRFNQNSFWSLQSACDIYGVKCPAPPLGMMTLSAVLPPERNIRLVNRNAPGLKPADNAWADTMLTSGMPLHCEDTVARNTQGHAHGKPVAVGGPDPTSSPESYELADFRVLGEAEGIIHEFVAAWNAGAHQGAFEGKKFQVDVTKSPIPRFDLI